LQPYVPLALGLAATGLASFFALTHHALRSFSRLRLEEAFARKGRPDQTARLLAHQDALVRTARALRGLGVVAAVVFLEQWSLERFGHTVAGWLVGALVAVALVLVFCEAVPTAWATYAPETILAATYPLLQACRVVFTPARKVLLLFDGLVRRLLGVPPGGRALTDIEQEIVSVAGEGERDGTLEEEQKDMIENVIKFTRTDASQIMTPRTDIVSIDAGAPLEAARRLIAESGFSRIPATHGNLDTIAGILYAKDLLDPSATGADGPLGVADVMRKPLFVPETKRLDELLRDFQANKVHLAVVLDEYGGTAGLVTIEDVIEEIVGEIGDEYEREAAEPIRRVAEDAYDVAARLRIDELNDALDLDLPEDEDYETVGGFVLSRLGYIPKPGESLDHGGVVITVLEADQRRIGRLRFDIVDASRTAPDD